VPRRAAIFLARARVSNAVKALIFEIVFAATIHLRKIYPMLTPKEAAFIEFWSANRLRKKRTWHQLLVGLPAGLLFGFVVMVNFYSGWYKRADMIVNNQRFNPIVLYVAVIAIAIFMAIFSKKFQWDQYEQRYRELLFRQQQAEGHAADSPTKQSTIKSEA
jgi:phosphotransferase system  glucose/maltose/N-acetylglucosamine-specific IIC component